MHYLYRITNQVNQKVYIGQTSKFPYSQRWAQHCYNARQQIQHPLYNSINKYTTDNFRFEIIAVCKTQEDCDYTEEQLIIQYDSRNRDKGYNIAKGGEHSMLGLKHSKESKLKMSLSKIGKHSSPATEFKVGGIGNPIPHEPWNKGKSTPIKLTAEQIATIKQDNRSVAVIAKEYGVHKTTIQYHKNKAG